MLVDRAFDLLLIRRRKFLHEDQAAYFAGVLDIVKVMRGRGHV